MATDDAQALAEQLLAHELPQRWKHVRAAAAQVADVGAALQLDDDALIAAAWLHDIGYASELLDTGFHPLDAARYLRTHGWPARVCALVAHHSDAARPADALGLGDLLRAEFADDAGIGRDVLWAADATTGPDGQRLTLDQRLAEITDRYGEDNFVTQCMIASRPVLQAAIDRVHTRLASNGR